MRKASPWGRGLPYEYQGVAVWLAALLTGLLLPTLLAAMLAALARILGLLARLLLPALLTTLIRVVLALLALIAFVRHFRGSWLTPALCIERRPGSRRSVFRDTKV
jgi:hypothetical protein